MRKKIALAMTALALAIPTAPAAAYSEICMEMPLRDTIEMWVDKLNSDEMRAAALKSAERGRFSYGNPRSVETRKSARIGHRQTKCISTAGFLSEGDIFRVRARATVLYTADPATCRPVYWNEGDSFWDWPEFYVQDHSSGRITFVYHYSNYRLPFEHLPADTGEWCQMKSGEGRWRGCYEGMNLLTPGCWKLPLKHTEGARVSQFIRDGDKLNLVRMVFLLIEERDLAGMDERLDGNETPLHLAARVQNKEFTLQLLRYGAKQTYADDKGQLPLHAAVDANRPDNARTLISYAKTSNVLETILTTQDGQGRTPFHLAVHNALTGDWGDILGILTQYPGRHLNQADETGETPLHTATRADEPDLVTELLAGGADPSIPHGKTGETAMDMATRLGVLKSAAVLLRHNAPRLLTSDDDNAADAVDENGQTALHRAALDGNGDAIYNLIRLGADPNIQDNNGDTAMILAIKSGHQDPVRYLLSNNGADPDLAGAGGDTALHWASRGNMYQVVRALIEEVRANTALANEKGETPLDVAARVGAVEAAAFLILHRAPRGVTDESDNPANGKNTDGDAPLHLAVMANNPDRITQLMQLQPDLNIRNNRGETPLLLALRLAEDSAGQMADILLAAGADAVVKDNDGVWVMHRAAQWGVVSALQAALDAGAEVDERDSANATPLHWALRNEVLARRNQSVELLLENGANPTLADDNGVVPLHEAARNDYHRMLDAAAAHPDADLDVRDANGATPLHWGVAGGQEYAVRSLLAGGADPFLRDKRNDFTALHWAAQTGNDYAARAIVQHHPDADLEAPSGNLGLTPLMMAVVEGRHLGFARAMLELGAKPDVVVNGASPLESAVRARAADMAAVLLENGADPNFASSSDSPPVFAAVEMGDTAMLRLLAEHGADLSRAGADNQFAEDLALANGHGDAVRALHELGREFSDEFIARLRADERLGALAVELFGAAYDPALNAKNASEGKTELHYAAQYNNLEGVKDLLRRGASPHIRSNNGQTPMMTAIARAHQGNERIVRVLLEAGTNPDEGDDRDSAPVPRAAQNNQPRVLEVLLEFGADPHWQSRNKFSALHLAAKNSPEAVRLLVEAGVDVNIPDRRGYTPLHWALDVNNADHDLVSRVFDELLALGAELIPDPAGNTLLELAEAGGNRAVAAKLRVLRAQGHY